MADFHEISRTTSALLDRLVRLRTDLADVLDQSRDLVWLGRQRRAGLPARARRIAGGADAMGEGGLIVDAIMAAGLCVECIERATGIASERVEALLDYIAETFLLTRAMSHCDGCLKVTGVHRLGAAGGWATPRDEGPARP